MTPNKRRKTKTRVRMEATGDNYARAARYTGSNALRDPARLSWSPGTFMVNEKPVKVVDSFLESDFPHLLVTGMSASQPEEMLIDMIDQISAANTVEDTQLWVIEPLIQLKKYEQSPHTARYVDSWSPNKNFMTNAADLMEDACAEMNRRYALMMNHQGSPKNLTKAREIALRESKIGNTPVTEHDLYLPFVFIVMHETGCLLAGASTKEERAAEARLIIATAEIVRKARGCGIFLVGTTQYPTNASMPNIVLRNMRRIGLTMTNEPASLRVVGDGSLVGLPKTKGIITGLETFVDSNTREAVEFDRNPDYYPYSYRARDSEPSLLQ